jgi:hypothetical protein
MPAGVSTVEIEALDGISEIVRCGAPKTDSVIGADGDAAE